MAELNVAIDPKTGNPVIRTTPEYKVKNVYAKNEMVVVVGDVGGSEVETIIDRKEAIYRAQAISDMANKATYASDRNDLLDLLEMFVEAIKKAKENSGKPYKSTAVAMTGFRKDENAQS